MDSNFQRPYIISWNLTYRCNLECEHCYLDAGVNFKPSEENPLDSKGELSTGDCFKIIDQIAEFAPEALTILTGGEPLLRRDILEIAKYASEKKLWVVVGSNGVKITENLTMRLKEAGVRGMALSLDSLDSEIHDQFRGIKGAWQNTVNGAKVLKEKNLSYIVQTTVGKHNWEKIEPLADFAYGLGAKVWNLYFLVSTGRGKYVSDITPEEYEWVLQKMIPLQKKYFQKMIPPPALSPSGETAVSRAGGGMMINAKCAPHFARVLFEKEPESPFLKSFSDGAGGCPAGTHYLGIRPNGEMTPCPYLPVFGGNLREKSFSEIWSGSEVFVKIRERKSLGGRCGACEFGGVCGGCRARAYGTTGDYMAEDPWCVYQPGKFGIEKISFDSKIKYGASTEKKLEWEVEAQKRMEKVPAFVRGMVVKAVESRCLEKGLSLVTVIELDEIRSKIPAQKIFSCK